jgi:hypothetical protein
LSPLDASGAALIFIGVIMVVSVKIREAGKQMDETQSLLPNHTKLDSTAHASYNNTDNSNSDGHSNGNDRLRPRDGSEIIGHDGGSAGTYGAHHIDTLLHMDDDMRSNHSETTTPIGTTLIADGIGGSIASSPPSLPPGFTSADIDLSHHNTNNSNNANRQILV